ncbi:Twinfilin-1 [Lithohypha guttulata]|uniref:Twinfilin-1 n=1 Tax=Lithohypha guttulata TaxID=1690604 RepID=UPI002DE1CC1B|nr:Twinfilin-1 [Lithohypha guttulata]KAK5103796.1 Twinfilin-1 [Lithohypha guttulata]
MQSGITASTELQEAFNDFTADSSFFALPITISNEALTPQQPIPFTSSDFTSSLPSLKDHLQPKTPIYLILRPSPAVNHGLIAVTYVPSVAPVRQKMLYASTRNTLTRDLGLEKFGDSVFATDDFEVLDPGHWEARTQGAGTKKEGGLSAGDDILTREERELQSVKRAEEEERHGTQGRDLMGSGGSGGRLAMKTTDDARQALSTLGQEGSFVQLGIEVSSETLELLKSEEGIQPGGFLEAVPGDRPSYSFYHYPGTEEVIFLYTCPGSSKVKERMVYASARASVLQLAKGEGLNVTKRLEQGDTGEVTEQRLMDEAGLKSAGAESANTRQGFARPKRPGKR